VQKTAKRVDEVDPEEMERRRQHLKAQRDLLLKKKKKEQESKLSAFHEVRRSLCDFIRDGKQRLLFARVCPIQKSAAAVKEDSIMKERVAEAVAAIVTPVTAEESKSAEELAVVRCPVHIPRFFVVPFPFPRLYCSVLLAGDCDCDYRSRNAWR
jgi:hypothetical protein